jgi:hypothetical protein
MKSGPISGDDFAAGNNPSARQTIPSTEAAKSRKAAQSLTYPRCQPQGASSTGRDGDTSRNKPQDEAARTRNAVASLSTLSAPAQLVAMVIFENAGE